ncbi:MAG TPA: MarR family transcriptional regulator [Solirubrobacteraceae bacterium]|nr:MarR family transcriptional regulator [Solirubrobacteraceae bacterium]
MVSPPTASLDLSAELEQRITALWWRLTAEAPSDLSRTAASVLATLLHEGPQRVTTLATREHVAQPSMSLLVQRLEKRGLVARTDDPEDRRACRIAITTAGEQTLRGRAEARSRWLSARLQRLDDAERATLVAALAQLDALLEDA